MTTWSSMEAMMSYPEVQKKAQAELGKHGLGGNQQDAKQNVVRLQIPCVLTDCPSGKTSKIFHISDV